MWWLFLVGCGGSLVVDGTVEPAPEACAVELVQEELAFDEVVVGEVVLDGVLVHNPCDETVIVDAVVESTGDFTLVDDSMALDPGEEGGVDVIFAPATVGEQQGAVLLATHGSDEVSRLDLQGRGVQPPDEGLDPAYLYVSASFGVTRTPEGGGLAVPYEVGGVTHPITVEMSLVADELGAGGPDSCRATWSTDQPVPVVRTGKGWMFLILDLPEGFEAEVEHDCELAESWPSFDQLLGAFQWGVAMSPLTTQLRTLLEDMHPPTWWQVNGEDALSGGFHASFVPDHPVQVAPVDVGWAWVADEELRVLDRDGGLWDGEGTPARYTSRQFEVDFVDEGDPFRPAVYVLEPFGAVDARWLVWE